MSGLALPGALRIGRILLGLAAMVCLAVDASSLLLAALLLMLAAEAAALLTRALDRQAAPGVSVEPVVDSLYHVWIFLGMLAAGWASAWLVFLLFLRELTAPYIYSFARQSGRELGRLSSERWTRLVYAVCQLDIVALYLIYGPTAEIAGTVRILLLAALGAGIWALTHCAWAAAEGKAAEG